MNSTLKALFNDEAGFVVSAELTLVATILVIGLIVGLSEIQHAMVTELNDVADAIGSLNQSYLFTGFSARKGAYVVKSSTAGSAYGDTVDACDNNECELDCDAPEGEAYKY
ncbi:hypothetical protein Mal4_47480 [Maioricimonas rarisocia]|uniref:Branched-chain amino acid aminotransferase n=1 Tax=Maioricimonas rarisocia TaxID=2528026 RepID=A0A517ZD54_9PLAN|nr:hypothetical protein [Maioricimonas rarisocia]QDU40392.1 hypothetical protein Mal4_47480 [Maioricimonas rarisocia]